jgi:hypothetical protein
MFSKLKQNIEDEEFQIDDRDNLDDIVDESDDLLTAKIWQKETENELETEKNKLDNSLEDII